MAQPPRKNGPYDYGAFCVNAAVDLHVIDLSSTAQYCTVCHVNDS